MSEKNPYLADGRLADVIAGITALANYRYYKLTFKSAAERIANFPEQEAKWKALFYDHPEFFRVSHDKVSLVWRRQNPKRYDPNALAEVSQEQFERMKVGGKLDRLSRRPLRPEETTALINVAVSLHERAVENQRMKLWWIPVLSASLAFTGALIGGFIS